MIYNWSFKALEYFCLLCSQYMMCWLILWTIPYLFDHLYIVLVRNEGKVNRGLSFVSETTSHEHGNTENIPPHVLAQLKMSTSQVSTAQRGPEAAGNTRTGKRPKTGLQFPNLELDGIRVKERNWMRCISAHIPSDTNWFSFPLPDWLHTIFV